MYVFGGPDTSKVYFREGVKNGFIKDLVLNLEWVGVRSPKLLVKQHIFYIMFIWHISKHISFP